MARYLKLLWPVLFTLLLGYAALRGPVLIAWVLDAPDQSPAVLMTWQLASAGFWLALGWLAVCLLDVFFWEGVVQHRTGRAPPRLMVELGRVVVLTLVTLAVITYVFKQPVTGLLVSSGVIGIVLGFALQPLMKDFFAGLALNVERPFHVGQWISIGEQAGQVIQINWRSTHMVTLGDTIIIVPNSQLAENLVVNFDLPDGHFRIEMSITLEYSVPIPDGKRVLLGGMRAVEGVMEDPPPDVLACAFGADGVEYRLGYYLSDYGEMERARDRVMASVSRALWQAGMSVPNAKRDVYFAPMPPRELDGSNRREVLLRRIELFHELGPDQIDHLSRGLVERRLSAGEAVVRQGEAGASMFVVVDGQLDVSLEVEGRISRLAEVGPGQVIGEMSLLTGEPRTASVTAAVDSTVFELSKEVLSPVVHQPRIAQQLSKVMAARLARMQQARLDASAPPPEPPPEEGLAQQLLHRIQHFFGVRS